MEIYTVYLSSLLVLWSVARQYDSSRKPESTAGPPVAEPTNVPPGYYDWR